MTRLIKVAILLVISIHFMVSCRPFVKIKAYTDLKCALPCWNGITPGVSDFAQVKTTLQNLAIVDQLDGRNKDTPEPSDFAGFYRKLVDGGTVAIAIKNDKVVEISVFGKSDETVSDLIQQVGPPESVYGSYSVSKSTDLVIYLLYPSRGVIYFVRAPSHSPYSEWDNLEGNMVVMTADYAVPGSIEAIFGAVGLGEKFGRCVTTWVQPWSGLGPIHLDISRC